MSTTNTGYRNTGDCNTGNYNTSYYNTGNHNTGDCNTGNYNTSYCNTGDRNTGNRNTGDRNTGDRNTGYCNTGDYNTGNYNTCNYSTGFFNTQEQPLYIFNRIVEGVSRADINTYLDIPLTEWVLPENMTEQEKIDNPSWETCEGFLKEMTFKEACKLAWEKSDEIIKQRFLNLPNFDANIFEEITGINVKEQIINIDGVEYTLSEIKKALKK